jgi:CheY-like chemotaxis protein
MRALANVKKKTMAQILIVDDESLTIKMLSAYLKLMGHDSVDALSSNQAKDRLAYLSPDAMLLDIMLPDMNGIELCRELRTQPATASLPIIMISAILPPMNHEAAAAGANAYLSKPIDLKLLKETLAGFGIPDMRSK